MFPRILRLAIDWVIAHQYYSVDIVELGPQSWFLYAPGTTTLATCVCLAVMDRFSCKAASELGNLGQVLSALGGTFHVVPIVGGFNRMGEVFAALIGNGNQQKQTFFNRRFLKRYMQKSSSFLFGSLDDYFMIEFFSENRD